MLGALMNGVPRRALVAVTLALLFAAPLGSAPAQAQGAGKPEVQVDEPQSVVTSDWAVRLAPGSDPDAVAQAMGAANQGPVGTLADTYVFRFPQGKSRAATIDGALAADPRVTWFEQQVARQQQPRGAPAAPPKLDPALAAKAEQGPVRVIVSFAAPLTIDDVTAGRAAQAEASASVAAVREAILADLAGGQRAAAEARWSLQRYQVLPMVALEVTAGELAALVADARVTRIQEDVPEPPSLDESVPLIGANTLHGAGITGSGVAVAILDTGVDNASGFVGGSRIVAQACFNTTSVSNGSTSVCPDGSDQQIGGNSGDNCNTAIAGCDHGTHVAGIAAGNNTGGGAPAKGVAPAAGIIALQVFSRFDNPDICGSSNPCALSYRSDQIAALEHIFTTLRSSFTVASANMSLGGGRNFAACDGDPRKTIIDNLRSVGIATVIASGNSGYTDSLGAPGCISTAITVGSSTKSDVISSFSNAHPVVDLMAPGSSINSSVPGGFGFKSGTSMATPHVAGAFALLRQAAPSATVDQIEAALESTGTPIADTRSGGTVTKPRIRVDLARSALVGSGPGTLAVSPAGGFSASGNAGGPFSPSSTTYTLSNTGGSAINFTASDDAAWLDVSPGSGSLGGGANTTVTVSVNSAANSLAAGSYSGTVSFTNTTNANDNTTRSASLTVNTPGAIPSDPQFPNQWHLRNTGQSGGTAGIDANVVPAWSAGYTGTGVVIGVVDDGLQYTHPDFAPNYLASASRDFNGGDNDPAPDVTSDFHGTSAGGVAAAADDGAACGAGAAYNAQVAGLRLIAAPATDAQEASALGHQTDVIQVYNNSWGPSDDGRRLSGPGPLTRAQLASGVASGRGGKGALYVWAAGNGLGSNDNVNYDGYANSPYTIAVGAIDHNGEQASYSEPGAAMLVTAPSSSSGAAGVTTTDLLGANGYDSTDCTSTFGGTSSAAPLTAGVVALMLEANANLSWRDVQHILLRTARQNDATDSDWATNGAGRKVNHKYGFGLVDAGAATGMAASWTNVAAATSVDSGTQTVNQAIPDSGGGAVSASVAIADDIVVEHVEVFFNATHTYRGDLRISVTSPAGTESVLAEKRSDSGDNYSDWRFMTTRNWGESSAGTWRIRVEDQAALDTGTFNSWRLVIRGTAPSTGGAVTLNSAVLPYGRAVAVGTQASAFGVVINSGTDTGTGCSVALPSGIPGSFTYQTTDFTTNSLTGTPNTPVDIAAGATQGFVFGITPSAPMAASEIAMIFDCTNSDPAASTNGLNTFILTAESTAPADMLSIGVTPSGDGIVNIPGTTGTGFFTIAARNIGATDTISASVDDGGRGLAIALNICETDPTTGACKAPPSAGPLTRSVAAGELVTYTAFVTGTANVPFDPANNRLFFRFRNPGSTTVGATNVAVRTQP